MVSAETKVASSNPHPALELLDPGTFATPESRRVLLDIATPTDYVEWVVGLNAASRNLDAHEAGIAGGIAVVSEPESGSFYCTVSDPLLKQVILARSFNAAKRMDDPEAIGTLLGISTLVAHVNDGSGRTSRAIYSVFCEGNDGSLAAQQRLSKLLEEGNRSSVDLNPERAELPAKFSNYRANNALRAAGLDMSADQLVVTEVARPPITTDMDETEFLPLLLNEAHFNKPFILMWAERTRRDIRDYMPAGQATIDANKVLADMRSDGLVNSMNIRDELNMDYVKTIVDCLASGDEMVYGAGARQEIIDGYRPGHE